MRKTMLFTVAALAAIAAWAAAPPQLFTTATESKWSVTKGGKPAGTITLLTNGSSSRAEFRADAKTPAAVYIGTNGKVWFRGSGGDYDFATISAQTAENMSAAALLAPHGASDKDLSIKNNRIEAYSYRGGKAVYRYDASGPNAVDVTFGKEKYTLTRTALSPTRADITTFIVRPRTASGSALSKLAGNILGPSDKSVSAGAAGRGAGEKGLTLKDGGDYAAVAKLEKRDDSWRGSLSDALDEFQQAGKVGKNRGQQ